MPKCVCTSRLDYGAEEATESRNFLAFSEARVDEVGIAVSDSTDAARSAADIVLTEPGLSVLIHAIIT